MATDDPVDVPCLALNRRSLMLGLLIAIMAVVPALAVDGLQEHNGALDVSHNSQSLEDCQARPERFASSGPREVLRIMRRLWA